MTRPAPHHAHPGIDLYLVDTCGAPVPAFPDLAPHPEQVYRHLPGDPREALAAAGLGHHSTAPAPFDGQGEDEDPVAFAARENDRLRATDGPGIALHKLTGTEYAGWWVTAEECAQALANWTAAGSPPLPGTDLPTFLADAAERGGFRAWRAY